ncbi:MAG: DMT family transporter [Blautia sp.]|nr:DMT family transporter [Blautia sp.]
MNKTSSSVRSSLLLLLTAAIWGVAFVAQSVGMEYVGGFTFNSVRFLIGAAVLFPFVLIINKKEKGPGSQGNFNKAGFMTQTGPAGEIKTSNTPPSNAGNSGSYKYKADNSRKDNSGSYKLISGGIVCGVLLCMASNFQQFGIKYTTVGKAGFITALYIILVPVFGLFLKKKTGAFIWAAVVLALVGLYLLCIKEGFSLGKGDILVMICAVLFAFQILAVDHYSPLVSSGTALSMIEFLVSGLLSAIPALLFEHPELSQLLAAWKPILYAGVFSSGIAYTLQIIAQKDLDPTVASLIMSLESSIAMLAGWLILGQTLSRRELTGCAVMFCAIILAQLPSMPATGTKKLSSKCFRLF